MAPRVLHPYDVEFARTPIPAVGSRGSPYLRWVRIGMPKLGQYTPALKTVFFLYPDVPSAKAGVKSGGTGFLVGVKVPDVPDRVIIHAVTNYHVAVSNKDGPSCPVIRINMRSGAPECFDLDPGQWIFMPGFSDIAISPPLPLNAAIRDYMLLDEESWFLSQEQELADEIGPGDDVFMIGRFVDYDGVETNVPAARFGHISMMDAKVEQCTGYNGRCIVLDMHSRSGFSGSPVIIYRTIGSHFFESQPGKFLSGGGHYIKLLGIHFAQFPEAWEFKLKQTDPISQAALKADTHYIEGLSGMTCIAPTADIRKVLHHLELVAMRKKIEIAVKAEAKPGASPKSESVVPRATDENPNHREDFTSLANAAARKQKLDE